MSGACTPTTTIIRSDGWHHDGPLLSSDADSVTIEGRVGPIVIPRSEVVDHDLPGDGLAISSAILGVTGLAGLARRGEGQTIDSAVGLAIGAVLAGWGRWVWRDTEATWKGCATAISAGAHGVLVGF